MLLVVFYLCFLTMFLNAYESGSGRSRALRLNEFIGENPEVEQFFNLIRMHTYLNNTLHWKPGTLLVPNNTALEEYFKFHDGKIDDNTIIYHFTNIQTPSGEMDDFISSDLPRNPPIWVTNRNSDIFLNDARIVKRDLRVRIGSEHIIHTLDRVLIPTVPNSVTGGSHLNNPDAKVFLGASTSYSSTNGYHISDFVSRLALLKRLESYHNVGKHTFFIPVNSGFQKTNIHNVDNKVIDGHILPGQIFFFPSVPLDREIQTLTYESTDPALAYQNFPIFLSFEKLNRTGVEKWNVISNNRVDDVISGTRYRKGKVQAEVVRANIPVRNGVIHFIRHPLVLIDTTIYEVLETQGNEDGGQMYEFFRIINDFGRHTGIYELLQRKGNKKLTLFVPTNEAIVKSRSFVNTLTNRTALTEILKLHILDQEVTTDHIFNMSLQTSAPIEAYTTRQDWKLHFTIGREGNQRVIHVEGGGTSMAVIAKADIGATNGVIHMINRVLGIEDQTMYEKLKAEFILESTFRLSSQNNYNDIFKDEAKRFTFFAPSNAAWDKFSLKYPVDHSKLFQGGHRSSSILDRHLIIGQEIRIEDLRNLSSNFGQDSGFRHSVPTYSDSIRISSIQDPDWLKVKESYGETSSYVNKGTSYYGLGPRQPSGRVYGDYKYIVYWHNQESYVVRANIKTTNGIMHIIDYPLIVPSDVVAGAIQLSCFSWPLLLTILLTHTATVLRND